MFFLNSEIKREIDEMRLRHQRSEVVTEFDGNDKAMGLVFRCFLSFALLVCGIVFPKITESVVPEYFKDIPVYIASNMSVEEIKDFIDSMAN